MYLTFVLYLAHFFVLLGIIGTFPDYLCAFRMKLSMLIRSVIVWPLERDGGLCFYGSRTWLRAGIVLWVAWFVALELPAIATSGRNLWIHLEVNENYDDMMLAIGGSVMSADSSRVSSMPITSIEAC